MMIKIILIIMVITLVNVIYSGYVHLQMFSDHDGACTTLLLGDYTVEGLCIDSMILTCSYDQSSVTATKYSSFDCSPDTVIGNETLATGGCVQSTAKLECTNEIDLPQDTNYLINVRHNSSSFDTCTEYKDGIVNFNYQQTGQCVPNPLNPKYSILTSCNSTSSSQALYKGNTCSGTQVNPPSASPLPTKTCTNSSDYFSSYQFCYVPNF